MLYFFFVYLNIYLFIFINWINHLFQNFIFLQTFGSKTLNELVKRKSANINCTYSDELRKFAVTLQFYSTKAYNFVRKQFCNILPHRTLTKWYKSINGDPGFTSESFNTLKLKTQENPIVLANVVVDEMSLKIKLNLMGLNFMV